MCVTPSSSWPFVREVAAEVSGESLVTERFTAGARLRVLRHASKRLETSLRAPARGVAGVVQRGVTSSGSALDR
jgi:hypothetical protein